MDNEKRIPKTAFDSEYKTEYLREVRFLAEKGIRYTYVHKTPDYGISQYKYTKTAKLFTALVEFYTMMEKEREEKKKNMNTISAEDLRRAQEILERAVQQGIIQQELKEENKDDTL